jgi:hypothetical protein
VQVNLFSITTDSDNNLDIESFEVIGTTSSGAIATIIDGVLTLDYSGITFNGTDQVRVKVCDEAGVCTESNISIEVNVTSEVEVFNAVAPKGSSPENRYLHISALPEVNKVSIYNRWGDKVWEGTNYDNDHVKFEGLNDNGNELPSGTYFYKIEYTVRKSATVTEPRTLPGYLSLKQ